MGKRVPESSIKMRKAIRVHSSAVPFSNYLAEEGKNTLHTIDFGHISDKIFDEEFILAKLRPANTFKNLS